MKLYLSGPVSNNDFALHQFEKAEKKYAKANHDIINPLKLNPTGTDWQLAMRKDIQYLMQCDGIIMLNGWERSRGAILEHMIALSLDMMVIYDQENINYDYSGIIAAAIMQVCGITFEQMKSASRLREYVDARRIFFFMLRRYTNMSIMRIGSFLHRDHCTVIHHIKSSKALADTDSNFREKLNKVNEIFLSYETSFAKTNQAYREACKGAESQH